MIDATGYTKKGNYVYVTAYYTYKKGGTINRTARVAIHNVKITVTPPKIYLLRYLSKNDHYTLHAVVPGISNTNIQWSSANSKIASVNDGKVQAKKPGVVKVTAQYRDISASAAVTVMDISKANASLVSNGGFNWDPKQGIWYSPINAIQRPGGYNNFYDTVFEIGEYITERLPSFNVTHDKYKAEFNYGGKTWRIEGWKGNYANMGIGTEVGLYYKGSTTSIGQYQAVNNSDMRPIKFSVHNANSGTLLFQRSGVHWWLNGFKPGVSSLDKKCIRVSNEAITFINRKIAEQFMGDVKTLDKSRFTSKTITGNTVTITWK